MKTQIPWLRVFVEGVVIVGSILLAFGLQAWWEGVQEREEEARLLVDLVQEFEANRTALARVTDLNRLRVRRLDIIIGEAGPDAEGVSPDSLNTLARLALTNPSFGVETGVMERAQSGNGLALISDPDLRSSVAGFWNRFGYYFSNQTIITHDLVFTPPVAFDTGTLVWQTFPKLEELGSTTMWSDPLTAEQARALKYFSMTRFIGNLLVTQGELMLTAVDDIIVDLEEAISR